MGYVSLVSKQPWQVRLYRISLMKKEKVRLVRRRVDFSGKRVCDLGSAQGTVSLQLKAGGGQWVHADLDLENLLESRPVLGSVLVQVDDGPLPLRSGAFDLVLLLDYLEHLEGDVRMLEEAHRLLQPGGQVVISTPILGEGFLLTGLKRRLGLTPEVFGHRRPGYTLEQLASMLREHGFRVTTQMTYAKLLVELVETLLNALWTRRRFTPQLRTGQISPRSASDLEGRSLLFGLYRWIAYPVVSLVTLMDRLLFWKTGYATLVIGRKE